MNLEKPNPAVAVVKSPNPLTRYSLLGSAQRLEDFAIQQKPLLGGLCLSGEATVWYAGFNTGKTLLGLYLVIEAVQNGRIAADDVFYINADDSSAGLAQKVRLMQDLSVHVLAPGHEGFKANMLLEKLKEMGATGTAHGKLIVIDTLKKFVELMDKKRAREFTGPIREFVMQGGTFLALAHTNKRSGPDGKPIPEGTADILSDFDCGYLLRKVGEVKETGDHIIEFECVKSRGPAVRTAHYSYDADPDLDYVERLCSVQEIDYKALEYEGVVQAKGIAAEIVDALESTIKHGTVTKMDIVRVAAMATGASRRNVLSLLDAYTGDDPDRHKWSFTVHARGAKVYSLLGGTPEPSEAQAE